MTWDPILHKDKIEESAIISECIQLMSQKFKDASWYDYFVKQIKPDLVKYSHEVLGINEIEAAKNINIVNQRREELLNKNKKNFNSLEEAIAYINKMEKT